jgi:hypothetical protein
MLDDLGTYALSDLLLFSRESYYRLFELYNRDVWPLQILAIGMALLWLIRSRHIGRATVVILALVWAWVAWAFHLERYATINFAAPYFAGLFFAGALLLVGVGGRLPPADTVTSRIGLGVVLYSVVFDPLIGLLAGRTWTALSLFGLGPDQTAMATIGVLLASQGRLRWLMLLPPTIWCFIALLTALAMGSVEALGPGLVLGAVIVMAVRSTAQGRSIRGGNAGASSDADRSPAGP